MLVCYKENFVFENYFSALPKQCWISMCKLRTNNHRFPIVTGRYNGTIREQRFCNKCSDNILGDEYHVTLECNNEDITALRCQYIPLYYRRYQSRYKFVQLMQNSYHKVQYNLALFFKVCIEYISVRRKYVTRGVVLHTL